MFWNPFLPLAFLPRIKNAIIVIISNKGKEGKPIYMVEGDTLEVNKDGNKFELTVLPKKGRVKIKFD